MDDQTMRLDLGPVPLRDADYTSIRANVMAKVQHRGRLDNAWRLAFAMIIAAFSYVAFRPMEDVVAPAPGHSTKIVLAATEPTPVEHSAPSTQHSAPPLLPVHHKSRRAHPRASLAKTAISEPMRIEIQTADPDVRIIWITDNSVEDSKS